MTKKGDKEQDEDSFAVSDSWILRTLLGTYRILSRTRRPKNNSPIGVAFTIASFFGLSLIRVIIFHSLLSLGWPRHSKMITDAAASLTSIVHSTLLCTWLTVLFWKLGWRRYVPSWKLVDHKNTDWQDAATACLEFCTGYMLFDAFWLVKDTHDLGLLPLTEFEMLVLAHHALTSFYMLSCRLIGAGHVSAMILMLTGEISNPLMNGMFVTRFAIQLECCSGETTAALHSWLEHSFAAVYLVFRIFIGPVCSVHVTYDLLTKRGRTNVPLLLSLVWVGMVWAVLWGSIPFIEEAMEMLRDGWKLKYHADFDFGERFRILKEEL